MTEVSGTYPGDGVVRPLDILDGVRLLGMELLDVLDLLRRRSLTGGRQAD
jgi:hypothetical protein